MGCVVAVYNKGWVTNSLGYSDIETWAGIQRAVNRLVQQCAPYGGAEYVGELPKPPLIMFALTMT